MAAESRSEAWEKRRRRVRFLRGCGVCTTILQQATDEEVARLYESEKRKLKETDR